MSSKIRVIIKCPDELYGSEWEIENSLKSLQRIVGGYIETVTYLGEGWCVICDEEGRLKGKPYNCRIGSVSFVGNIIFAGVNGDEFGDFPLSFEEYKNDILGISCNTGEK